MPKAAAQSVAILGPNGQPLPRSVPLRQDMMSTMIAARKRRMEATYDAARDTDQFKRYWANADARDADTANDPSVRQKLRNRSRYEKGSNGYYAGIVRTYTNMLIGKGPTLRMLTANPTFNATVETAWHAWTVATGFRRKLWCMAHALIQDGESFGVLQDNPGVAAPFNQNVQLDVLPIEAEQCQTPYIPFETGYIDGIRYDEFGNILWYDVLPTHPGSGNYSRYEDPLRVSPANMLHWFKLERPGSHRGIPIGTSTLNTGAGARRHREATIVAAEVAADLGACFLKTQMTPEAAEEMQPFSTLDIEHGMMTALPEGWDAFQMRPEHPNANYSEFHRANISEEARPFSMPYNLAACDSSTYSFASGKLDVLCFWSEIDVVRCDCDELVLDKTFTQWFREWTILRSLRNIAPSHQWDWPAKPVIDAVAEAASVDTKLHNGTISLRQAYTDTGQDFTDALKVMAEDYFGDSSPANIQKMRTALFITHYPAAAEAMGLVSEDGQREEMSPEEDQEEVSRVAT